MGALVQREAGKKASNERHRIVIFFPSVDFPRWKQGEKGDKRGRGGKRG